MRRLLLLLGLLSVLCLGCNDEDCPECPDPSPTPTLANLWPHADGADWLYDFTYLVVEAPAPAETAPPLPSLQALHDALGEPLTGDVLEQDQGLYRLRFDGEVTTESGVVAQNLVGTTYHAAAPPFTGRGQAGDRRLLELIASVRPDLRSRILERIGGTSAKQGDALGSSLYSLGSCAFAFEDSGCYAYGDLSTDHSWIFLEGDLTVGSGFELQLVPELADDIWLRGRIWAVGDRTVGGESWSNVLECLSVIDLGVQVATDEQGDPVGEVRSYIFYTTLYAPGFGPIMSVERQVLAPDGILQDGGGIHEYRCIVAR